MSSVNVEKKYQKQTYYDINELKNIKKHQII